MACHINPNSFILGHSSTSCQFQCSLGSATCHSGTHASWQLVLPCMSMRRCASSFASVRLLELIVGTVVSTPESVSTHLTVLNYEPLPNRSAFCHSLVRDRLQQYTWYTRRSAYAHLTPWNVMVVTTSNYAYIQPKPPCSISDHVCYLLLVLTARNK